MARDGQWTGRPRSPQLAAVTARLEGPGRSRSSQPWWHSAGVHRATVIVVSVLACAIPGCNSGSATPAPGPQQAPRDATVDADIRGLAGKPLYLADAPRFIGYVRHAVARYSDLAPLGRLLDELEGRAPRAGYTF